MDLNHAIELHKKWLNDEPDGQMFDLRGANLRDADLSDADMSRADLSGADLSNADLSGANLIGADLSGASGIMSPIDFMEENFQKTQKGLVVFKTFDNFYKINPNWNIAPGAIISETVNPSRCSDCGCGINVGTLGYVRDNNKKNLPIWKLLIRWEWLPGVVVPFNTDGKIRCERAELIEIVDD